MVPTAEKADTIVSRRRCIMGLRQSDLEFTVDPIPNRSHTTKMETMKTLSALSSVLMVNNLQKI